MAVSVLFAAALAGACGDEPGAPVDAEASEADVFASLKPPSVGGAGASGGLPLDQAVSFVDCDAASEHVGGVLDASAKLVEPDHQRLCYVELLDQGTARYAGAIIVSRTWDVGDNTILDAIEAGAIAVTVSAGFVETGSFAGTHPDAPGGGYAEFELDDQTIGRVVRIHADRSQAMFSIATAAGPTRVEVTSRDDPRTLVEMARTTFSSAVVMRA